MRTAEYSNFLSNNTVFAGSGCSPPPWGAHKKVMWLKFPSFSTWITLSMKLLVFWDKRSHKDWSLNLEGKGDQSELDQWSANSVTWPQWPAKVSELLWFTLPLMSISVSNRWVLVVLHSSCQATTHTCTRLSQTILGTSMISVRDKLDTDECLCRPK